MNILKLQNNNKVKHRNSTPNKHSKELNLNAEVNEKKKNKN
jgi:hypothetical protein